MPDNRADTAAFDKVSACEPQWAGMCKVSDVLHSAEKVLLHAGPPFNDVQRIPAPVMNSLCVGAIYEGWADDSSQARDLIISGDIKTAAAQDHDIVVPLAGVVSPSMQLMIVNDARQPEKRKYSVLNEGMVHCTRLGVMDPELPEHLIWLNTTLSSWVGLCLEHPIKILPVIEQSLIEGDDCHGRTIVGSALIVKELRNRSKQPSADDIDSFLDSSIAFSLNIWMAACSLMMAAAENSPGSALITRAGGNGMEFGVQVAAQPGQWIVSRAPAIKGNIEAAHSERKSLGAIGDSAVVDFMGLGGQVLDSATQSFENLKSYLPEDALERPKKVLQKILPGFGQRLAVTNARLAAENKSSPLILLGMIDSSGEAGRIGGGVVDIPPAFFEKMLGEVHL